MRPNTVIDGLLKSIIPELVNNMDDLNPNDEELTKLENILQDWKTFAEVKITKQKPNERCKCESGKKYKKCCHLINVNNDIQKLVNYDFTQINNKVVKLYNNTVKDGQKVLNPNEYFERQAINRRLFELLDDKVEDHYLREELETTSIYLYFKFMYDNYPPRIDYFINHFKNNGDSSNENNENNGNYDILEIYYNLTK